MSIILKGCFVLFFFFWGNNMAIAEEAGGTTNRVQISLLQKKVTDLKSRVKEIDHDLENLCKENQMQRKLLIEKNPRKTAGKTIAAKSKKKSKAPPDCKYWLSLSTKKRHVPGCRYFGISKGRPCSVNEGIPCKICGGGE